MGTEADPVPILLRVNRIQYPVRNLGPGRRIGVWVQGCSLRCRGCVSASLQTRAGGTDLDVRTLAEAVAGAAEGYDGVTISGGEPFEQYGPLMAFCAYLKAISALTVFVYSGYTLAELDRAHPDGAFRRCCDWLVDGRFVEAEPADEGWRGSTNQRLIRFVGGEAVLDPEPPATSAWSIAAGPADGPVYMVGIPRPGTLERLARDLETVGMKTRFE